LVKWGFEELQEFNGKISEGFEKILSNKIWLEKDKLFNNYKYCNSSNVEITRHFQPLVNALYQEAKLDNPFVITLGSPEENSLCIDYIYENGFSIQPKHKWFWNRVAKSAIGSAFLKDHSDLTLKIAYSPIWLPAVGVTSIIDGLVYLTKSSLHKDRKKYLREKIEAEIRNLDLKNMYHDEQIAQVKQSAFIQLRSVFVPMWKNIFSQLEESISESYNNAILREIYSQICEPFSNAKKSVSSSSINYWNASELGFESGSRKNEDVYAGMEFGIGGHIGHLELFKFSFLEKIGAFHNETFSSIYYPLVSNSWSLRFYKNYVIVTAHSFTNSF
jgi:hypothetical protein